jgi:hypothetical protein
MYGRQHLPRGPRRCRRRASNAIAAQRRGEGAKFGLWRSSPPNGWITISRGGYRRITSGAWAGQPMRRDGACAHVTRERGGKSREVSARRMKDKRAAPNGPAWFIEGQDACDDCYYQQWRSGRAAPLLLSSGRGRGGERQPVGFALIAQGTVGMIRRRHRRLARLHFTIGLANLQRAIPRLVAEEDPSAGQRANAQNQGQTSPMRQEDQTPANQKAHGS